MPKEVIAAIIVGGVLGIAIAFGVWRANIALTPKNLLVQTQSPTPVSPSPATSTFLSLTITSPEDESVIDKDSVTLTGKATSLAAIAIVLENSETIVTADKDGIFSSTVKLSEGPNIITVTAFTAEGETIEKQITIVYSTQI